MIGFINKQAKEYFDKAERIKEVRFEIRLLQCAIRFPDNEEFKLVTDKINNNEKIN